MTEHIPAVSEFTLERFLLNELAADEAARIAESVQRLPALQRRLDALRQSDEDIRAQYPPEWMAQAIRDRVSSRANPPGRTSTWRWAAAAAAAVLVVALALPRPRDSAPKPGAESAGIDRVKGANAALMIYRKDSSRSEQLSDGDAAANGDVIRVAYRAAGRRFGVIVSVDARGEVTQHLPVGGTDAPLLQAAGGTVLLDQAYELDNAPRWEQFFLVTGDRSFDVSVVLAAARRATEAHPVDPPRTLALPAGLGQSTFLLRKITKETSPR